MSQEEKVTKIDFGIPVPATEEEIKKLPATYEEDEEDEELIKFQKSWGW